MWDGICGRENEKNSKKTYPDSICPLRNPRGMTERRTRDSSGGRRANNCLGHGGAIHSFSVPWAAHSPTFPSLHLRHRSFSKPFVALPTSQLILQPFRCFTYVTAHSPTLLSPPMLSAPRFDKLLSMPDGLFMSHTVVYFRLLARNITRRPLKVLKSCFCNRFLFCLNPYIKINSLTFL